MAKCSMKSLKKNRSEGKLKKRLKKKGLKEEKPEVMYDDDAEEETVRGAGEDLSSDEEQLDGNEERRHRRLLEAMSSLPGARRKSALEERAEPAATLSEFSVAREAAAERVELVELIGTAEKTPAVPSRTNQQLKGLQRSHRTLQGPLSQQQSQRIHRDLVFRRTSSQLASWTPIITHNRRAPQLLLPPLQEAPGPQPLEQVVSSWKTQTPLEQEVFGLLASTRQPVTDPLLTPTEEASLRAMSLEEARLRRAQLQKARALQSYYESRARRDRKIKSKKYHRVHNKARSREFLKSFEEQLRSDPEGALQELQRLEDARMQERMSLKHQNSSRWAKSRALMAKYDLGARRAMQEQLELNKDLMQRPSAPLSQEEEEEEEAAGDPEKLPDCVNDAEQGGDPSNPWMRGRLNQEPTGEEEGEENRRPQGASGDRVDEEEEEEEEETEEEALLREFNNRRMQCDGEVEAEKAEEPRRVQEEKDEELIEFPNMFGVEDNTASKDSHRGPASPLEEVQLLSGDLQAADRELREFRQPPQPAEPSPRRKIPGRKIELKAVLTKESRVLGGGLAPTLQDCEESQDRLDQRGLIQEAFAGDDVVSDFLRDKRKQEEAGGARDVDLTLPGWGEWGEVGRKPSAAKRRRFRTMKVPPPPRKDQRLPAVIISEKSSVSLGPHRVSMLPFPFQTRTQFHSTLNSPLGRTWNTETTVKKLTQPRIVTIPGAIIPPMDRQEMKDGKLARFN